MKQKRHGPSFTGNSNKIDLTFFTNDWNHSTSTITFDGETGSQTFAIPFEPNFIIPDYYEKQSDAITDRKLTIIETGSYTFPGTYMELDVQEIDDSAFVYIAHQWAPPDPLQSPVQGLTISDYRYWIVDGIFPEGFNTTGVFWYNRNNYLDDGIITSEADSVVLLYRPSPALEWQYVNFTKIGNWSIGKLFVDNLQKGQYTIAVADDTFVGTMEQKTGTGFRIYPNPNNGSFQIDANQPGTLTLYDATGRFIEQHEVSRSGDVSTWQCDHLSEGTYFVQFRSEEKKILGAERVIVLKN
jgi:aminopeptidase N